MKIVNSTLKRFFNSAQLIEKNKVADNAFGLRLKLDSNSFRNYIQGQHLSILVGLDDTSLFENPTRCYSVWNYDSLKQEVTIAACTNSSGIGTVWLNQLQVGNKVYFSGPEGKFVYANDFENYFFFGDSSALGHLYNIRRQLSRQQKAQGIFYSSNLTNLFADIDGSVPFEFIIASQNPVETVASFLSNQKYNLQKTVIYIAGETAFCVSLNRFCRNTLQLDPKQIRTKPFWHPNKKGLE